MPALPWYPWWPMDAAASFHGLPRDVELSLRQALDRSWIDGAGGAGTLEQWRRWGLVEPSWQDRFDVEIQKRCQLQPDGETYVHLRLARHFMAQSIAYQSTVRAGKASAEARALRRKATAVQRPLNARSTAVELALQTEVSKEKTRFSSTSASHSKPDYSHLPIQDRPLPWEVEGS